jgi:hypothetical protein
MKKLILAALCGLFVVAPTASAGKDEKQDMTTCERAWGVRDAVVKKHGKRAPGRNICRYGIVTKKGKRDATDREKRSYYRALKRLNSPPPAYLVRTSVPPRVAPANTASPGIAAGSTLSAIAACESGGDPGAISPDGKYRGKYQFDYGTWQSVGGSGDPAAASEAEQDQRAAMLYSQRGAQPWPVCGR